MTAERDLDFRLAAWLDERATTVVPDVLLSRSLARVAVTRQRQGWLVGTGRSRRDDPSVRVRTFVVIAAVVILATLWITALGIGRPPSLTPSPTPAVTNSPSPTGPFLPPSLRSNWVGPTRDVPQIAPRITLSALALTALQLQFLGGGPPILSSAAVWLSGDHLTFRLSQDEAGCHRDDLGTYTFALNETSRALTVDVVGDPCEARAAAISGAWSRAQCPNHSSLCLGDLDPGQHVSAAFNPFVRRDAYVYDYGRLSYTVPDGWSNQIDGPDGYSLARQGAPEGEILLFSTAMADSQALGCPGTIEPGIGHTAAALATWLTTLPGVVATTPEAVSVGGLSGFSVDLSIRPSWTQTCPYSGGKPDVAMFTHADSVNKFDWGLTAGGAMRLFLLDLPDGRTTLIDVEAQDRAAWDALISDATPVIGTFAFHQP